LTSSAPKNNHSLDISTLEGWLWEADERLKKVLAGLGLELEKSTLIYSSTLNDYFELRRGKIDGCNRN